MPWIRSPSTNFDIFITLWLKYTIHLNRTNKLDHPCSWTAGICLNVPEIIRIALFFSFTRSKILKRKKLLRFLLWQMICKKRNMKHERLRGRLELALEALRLEEEKEYEILMSTKSFNKLIHLLETEIQKQKTLF